MASDNREGKSKAASILVAVFLSFWTWLYTYEKDAWKFWVGLVLPIAAALLILYAFYDPLSDSDWPFTLIIIINAGIWIWSIVDTVLKKDEWYHSYSGKKVSS